MKILNRAFYCICAVVLLQSCGKLVVEPTPAQLPYNKPKSYTETLGSFGSYDATFYTHNTNNQLTEISTPNHPASPQKFTYNSNKLISITYGTFYEKTLVYDAMGRISRMEIKDFLKNMVTEAHNYIYNTDGQLIKMEHFSTRNGNTLQQTGYSTIEYDGQKLINRINFYDSNRPGLYSYYTIEGYTDEINFNPWIAETILTRGMFNVIIFSQLKRLPKKCRLDVIDLKFYEDLTYNYTIEKNILAKFTMTEVSDTGAGRTESPLLTVKMNY